VPNFPDPLPGHGFAFSPAGINPGAPAVKSAQAKCQALLPRGGQPGSGAGPPGPGSTTHPSKQTLAKLVKIARCMHQHGAPEFPEPRTSVPPNPFGSGGGVITDYDGAIVLFPGHDQHGVARVQGSGGRVRPPGPQTRQRPTVMEA
jgi:hypothetical protein